MIVVKDLVKNFETDGVITKALRGVSFEIKKGEFVAIMGPSGSGKSTLLNILSFLDRPTSGDYTWNGKHMNELSDKTLARIRNKDMGYVFQTFNLLGRSTVYQNVEVPLLYSVAVEPNKRKEMIEQAVAAVGLTDKLHTEASRLSGGQKQRVAMARAIVNDPDIIFADEPTGNLDSVSGEQIMELLSELHHQGKTVVLVTHETFTSEYAHRLIRLRDGQVELDKPITERRKGTNDSLK